MAVSFQPQFRNPALTTAWTSFGPTLSSAPVTVTGLTSATPYDFRIIAVDGTFTAISDPLRVSTAAATGAFSVDFSTQFG